MSNRTFSLNKDNTSAKVWGGGKWKGRGTNDRLLVGKVKIDGKFRKVRSFIKWDYDWSGVEVVTAATMTLTVANNSGDTELVTPSSVKLKAMRLTKAFSKGTSGDWTVGAWAWPPMNLNVKRFSATSTGNPGDTLTINMLPLLIRHAPKRVAFLLASGKKVNGMGLPNHGFALLAGNESNTLHAGEFWSHDYGTSASRPKLEIEYEQVNTAPTAGIVAPDGNVTADFDIDGTFTDTNADDYMTQVRIQIDKSSEDYSTPLIDRRFSRDVSVVDDQWHVTDGDYDKSKLKKGVSYKVRAKVFDKKSKVSDWSANSTFTITSDTPTVTAESFGSIATLDGVFLGGAFTVDSLTELLSVDWQVLSGSTVLWNYSRPVHQSENDNGIVRQEYGGPTLDAGAYTYKVSVTDKLGGQSTQSTGSFTLTADAPDTDEDLTNVTGYSTVPSTTRIKLFGMDSKDRGPKGLKAIIEDAANVGISWYASSPGELFFTLPVTHPQISACDPLVTHYRVEQYRRGRWKLLAAGLITDFDARSDDVIVMGMDYLGLLSWSVEAAKQPATNHKKNMPTKPTATTGSRYFNKPIRYIIRDQLRRARYQDSNSPVKFIDHKKGTIGNFSTKVTIYASFAQRLNFIRGLIDSHKGAITTGGGERRSRIRVRWRKDVKRWVFDVLDNVGSDRDNIRLEYGSVLQNYQVKAIGDYANLIYGTGKEPNKLKPHYNKQGAPGIDQSDWGSIGKASFWPDLTDNRDLARRARAEAIRASRIGKRIALAIRVHGLNIWDGYEILDNIPIDVDDGVVDTSQYGSGYWTIWGGEYRLFPDGHDEVTLIVRPKGDGAAIDTDLIDSDPIHSQSEWKIGSGAPAASP